MRPLKACLCVSHVVHAESLLCSSINKVFLLNISSTSYSTSNSSNTAQIEKIWFKSAWPAWAVRSSSETKKTNLMLLGADDDAW